jgi:hypothetical protein
MCSQAGTRTSAADHSTALASVAPTRSIKTPLRRGGASRDSLFFDDHRYMELAPRKRVLIFGTIEFADSEINCIVGNMSIAGAALDLTNSDDVPERFTLVFEADNVRIPCHTIWRKETCIGVAFD